MQIIVHALRLKNLPYTPLTHTNLPLLHTFTTVHVTNLFYNKLIKIYQFLLHLIWAILQGQGCFQQLQNIWKSKKLALKTKIKLYNSNVKSVLLNGAECWRTVETEINKVNAFHNYCLRRICNIYWPNKI